MEKVYKQLFYDLVRIRMIEEEIARLYPEQEMRCPVHLSVGQEATPVGIFAHLNHADHVVSTHRAHAHYLAKKGSLKKLIAELYGRVDGCTKGQGGSMHLIDLDQNFLASTSIVGGTIPIGVGSALTAKLKNEKRISVVCIGDTAIEEGVFHESMNFAALKKLPVIFMCENNNYSCYSPLSNRQPSRPLINVAIAHNISNSRHTGNDVFALYNEVGDIVKSVRNGDGPYFIETDTFRYLEHCGPGNDDELGYRKLEEIQKGHVDDAILNGKKFLESQNLFSEKWEKEIRIEIKCEIAEAFECAKNSPFPPRTHLGAFTYAE